jgi:uncharacterized membrane protein YeiH
VNGADVLLLAELLGTLVFALNGALTAIQSARLDIVGVIALGTVTALGGGVMRDVLLPSLPPRGLNDWRYLGTALVASAAVFVVHRRLARFVTWVTIFDAAGLSLFCVVGTLTAIEHGASPLFAVLLGTITSVGGGTVRDLLVGRIPAVLTNDLYAVPALIGSVATLGAWLLGWRSVGVYLIAALLCFAIRMVGVRFNLQAPHVGPEKH